MEVASDESGSSERGGWAWTVVKVVAGEKGLGGGTPRRGFLGGWVGRRR